MTLLPGNRPAWEKRRRAELEAQRLAYMARGAGPGPSVESQAQHIEGAANVAPKPLETGLAKLKERTRSRRRAVRQAGRLPTPERAPEPVTGLALKVWPALAQRAMLLKRDREYRLWVLARSLDPMGSGRVRVDDILALGKAERLRGLSPGAVRRLLKRGAGTFWEVFNKGGDKWLELRGLGSVALSLEVQRLSHWPVVVPVRWLQSLRGFRSVIYASAFPGGDEFSNPISRATMTDLTGAKPRAQRNYDKALGRRLDRQENAEVTGLPLKHGYEIPTGRGYYVDKVLLPNGREDLALFRRMPNSYRLPGFARGKRGMAGKVNSELRYSLDHVAREARQAKLVYRDHAKARKRIKRLAEGEYILKLGCEFGGRYLERNRSGQTLHTRVSYVNGQTCWSSP